MIRNMIVLWFVWFVPMLSVGATPGGDVAVRSATGETVRPLQVAGRKATVLLFIAHDCPVSNSYAPEFTRLCKKYGAQKIGFYAVYVEADLAAAEARQHAHDYGYVCPALLDPQHRLVKVAGATVTPEAAVFTADGKRVYLGRVDNQYAAIGQRREVVTVHDLRDVLDHVLAGTPVATKETTAFGCFIPPINVSPSK
jgi:thiol-disulfide isomerase/thioredoxin